MSDAAPIICSECVLSTAVPRVTIDAAGVCNVCHEYRENRAAFDSYFRTEADLLRLKNEVRGRSAKFDCLLLFSGGKDSTYVLYRLIDMGFRVLTFTFDNGYIPEACFENIRRVCVSLGVGNVTGKVERPAMDAVFAISLQRDGTVCSGCFRALTARSTELAIAEGIPMIVTGLSRGQIFDTKVHQLLSAGITNAHEIDAYLGQFRHAYHTADDDIARRLNDRAAADAAALQRTVFVDFFRYAAVTKPDIMRLIAERAMFWRRPAHVGGCSTNCMINDVGIQEHRRRKGFHNYAIPLAWDVRFGHISRTDALRELDEDIDVTRTAAILHRIGVNGAEPSTT